MKKVTIYTTPTCGYCHMAKDYFKEEGIEYNEKDVSVDAEARDEMMAKTNQMGVPVIDVEGDIVIGFNKAILSELLVK
jgi:glutaredoxin-like YruB-family protein